MDSRVRSTSTTVRLCATVLVMILAALLTAPTASAAPPLPGAIFTTNSACDGTNINIFADKGTVYLNGGPTHPGAAALPNGAYYVQVTEPGGTVLGKSLTPTVSVVGGKFAICYQLAAVVLSATSDFTAAGYDTTTNPGGGYKVWVSSTSTFDQNSSKTDYFKVQEAGPGGGLLTARLQVKKFYDANANGLDDDGIPIEGWRVRIVNGVDYTKFTPVDVILAPDTYTVTESSPIETNWAATTSPSVVTMLAAGDDRLVTFGNLCVGPGGGKTLGYWSNKNGQADFIATPGALTSLGTLKLRNANGGAFVPASYAAYRTWLLNATATNMAYMLSAQLSATHLNVLSGKVSASAIIRAEGTISANTLGYATVGAVIAEATANLAANGVVLSDSSHRAPQEALKNALDAANNDLSFVQAAPCSFTFLVV